LVPCAGEGADVVLTLPDVRQSSAHSCGDAALRIVWEFFGVPVRSRAVATPVDGLAPDTLESALWRSGLSVQAGTMDELDLKYHTGRGRPVVCCVTEADGSGHWIVCAGMCRRKVYYQCPLGGPKSEGVEEFLRRWTDGTRRGITYLRWGMAVSCPDPA
jgi:ABC-type bacteriocin/lantibiotic exporter with double-glycine peptidase domain